MNVWDKFWKDRGKSMEWNQKDILNSSGLNEISEKVLNHIGKKSFKDLTLLELGSGMGITSLFFGHKGAKVTLLDLSEGARPLAREYWGDYAKHKFIVGDLFKYKPKEKYDIVSSFGLCEHFVGEKRREVLQKHVDLLSKKSVAILSMPYRYGIFYRIAKKLAEISGFWGFGLEVPFDKRELIEFANSNNLKYEIIMEGFYSSAYDLFVRKPLRLFKITTKRRFDSTKSSFDRIFGSGIIILLKKG